MWQGVGSMKYPSHGHLTVDDWRQYIKINEVNAKIPLTKAVQETVKQIRAPGKSKLIPTMAGFTAVASVYAAVPVLVAADGPLPFGDVLAVGLLAIPDAAIFAFGYSLFD
ncbi:MAG: hypothetical protein [Cressdnaviricota sp.]|nr:MAG: hypothetical protein [Cressdnaviricota sp.]